MSNENAQRRAEVELFLYHHCLLSCHSNSPSTCMNVVLGLAHYPSVMELLQPRMKREMATKIVQVQCGRQAIRMYQKLTFPRSHL